MKTKPLMLALTSGAVLFCGLNEWPVSAQTSVPPLAPAYQPLSDQQLDQLLGPIALYPDPLLAEILPAATLPTQIVLADRYISNGGDPNQAGQQPWDPSVQALAHYPTVLKYMDDNLGWTTELGQAFASQQPQVMASIQKLRAEAQSAGNLQTTPQQQVENDNGNIEILPSDANDMFVPTYQPDYVYDDSGYGPTFWSPCLIGPWLNCDFDWFHRSVRWWDRDHRRPDGWWHDRPDQRDAWMSTQPAWQPINQSGIGTRRVSRGDRGWNQSSVNSENNTPYHFNVAPRGNELHPLALPSRPAPVVSQQQPFRAQVQRSPAPVQSRQFSVQQQQQQFQYQQRQLQIEQQLRQREAYNNLQRSVPAFRTEPSGAFVGSESAGAARNFSERGQESFRSVSRPAPVEIRSAPAVRSFGGGGGGGFRGSGRR